MTERELLEKLWGESAYEVMQTNRVYERPMRDGKKVKGPAWIFDIPNEVAYLGFYSAEKGSIDDIKYMCAFHDLGEGPQRKLEMARKAWRAHHKLVEENPR